MTNNTHAQSSSRGSAFRAAPLPEPPGPPSFWPDRATLLRDQANALGALVREDLSRARATIFLVCAVVVTAVAALTPVLVVDAATSEGNDATDVAVTAVLACLLLAIFAIPALLVLRSLRARGARRRELLHQWAAVDRGYDAEFPSGYGSRGYPHARFFNAAFVLALALILGVAVLADVSDTSVLAMLPGLIVAGVFAWAVIRKYADRYGWAAREQVIRGRERRRQRYRGRLTGTTPVLQSGTHPALIYLGLFAPAVIVILVFVIARPQNALGLAAAGLIALAVLVLGLPKVVLTKRRERAALAEAARTLAPSFSAGAVVHPIRYGLSEATEQPVAGGPSDWDQGPVRAGALALDAGTLHLRGVDGSTLELHLSELAGVALVPSTVAWLDPTVDLLLGSEEAIEVRSPDAKAITEALSGAGVRVV